MIHSLIAHTLCCINLWLNIVGWLAEILCLASLHIIYIYVGIGRDSILCTFLLTAGISYELRILAPINLLNTTKWSQRTLVRFAFEYINTCSNTLSSNICNKWMCICCNVMVPVTIVHIGDDHTRSLWQVAWVLLDSAIVRDALDKNNTLTVWRESETFDVDIRMCQLLTVCTVCIHCPQLSTCKECQGVVVEPCCITLTLCRGSQQTIVLTIGIHHA